MVKIFNSIEVKSASTSGAHDSKVAFLQLLLHTSDSSAEVVIPCFPINVCTLGSYDQFAQNCIQRCLSSGAGVSGWLL